MTCQQCKKELPSNSKFCGYCGASIRVAAPEPELAVSADEVMQTVQSAQEAVAAAVQPLPAPVEPPRQAPPAAVAKKVWWKRKRLWAALSLAVLLVGSLVGWRIFLATPMGLMTRLGLNLRNAKSVEFALTEPDSDLHISGSWMRSGPDWVALIRTDDFIRDELGFVEFVEGEMAYWIEGDDKWEEGKAPWGYSTPERTDFVGEELFKFFTNTTNYKRWKVDNSRKNLHVLSGRLPGDLVAYLQEGLYGGKEPSRLPPDAEFRLTVDTKTGLPTRLTIDVVDPRSPRFMTTLELRDWNLAEVRVPGRLRPLIRWPY